MNFMESGMTSRRPKAALRNLLKLTGGSSARRRMFYSFLLFVVSNELLIHVARINIREKEDCSALEELDLRFLIAAAVCSQLPPCIYEELEGPEAVGVVLLGELLLGGGIEVGEDGLVLELGGGFLGFLGHGLALAKPGGEEVNEEDFLLGDDIGEVLAGERDDIPLVRSGERGDERNGQLGKIFSGASLVIR